MVTKMFTGIIRYVGKVLDARPSRGGARLRVDIGPLARGLAGGDSVAVNGACLTASDISGTAAAFDVIAESLDKSTLGDLRAGAWVNLERALPASGRFDGHVVQGHVDGVATVAKIGRGDQCLIEFTAEAGLVDQMVPKGSIAIDGVSLTLVQAAGGRFSVAIIPTTLAETTLGNISAGQRVNIETDILGKYVRRYLQTLLASPAEASNMATPQTARGVAMPPNAAGLTMDKLKQAGFL